MKKYWAILAIAGALTACQESLEDRCAREAETFTRKNCPAKMGNNTTLDSLTFDRDSHTLRYYYHLSGTADQDSIMDKIDATEVLRKELKNTTSLQLYKENRYKFGYTFYSEKNPGKVLLDVLFTEEDY